MTAITSSDQTAKRSTRRKIAAVLAGGLVLGVGTMATLASWNDSEFASATFTAGKFNLEGAVDASQATFSEHATSGAAGGLTFTAPVSLLTPTDVVAAPYAVRLAANTTNNATLNLVATTTTGTVTNLTYEVIKTSTAGCTTATTAGTIIIAPGTPVTSVSGATPIALSMGTPTTTAGAPAYLCFKVTAGASLAQSQTGAVNFQFQAVSQ
ncbi:MAG TPA: SipW-dependent-type signal peptide-containing protein [Propionicimonas sp.]|jgi:predicted ribosomally synthesized peptide with SipW-like signal peptide|uniref:SipW-dependent-type signal peptide-containing protein n=1 Tax=Propionicimonas sp. TaxID=1955623 RepID=UPI002F413AFB